jgi:hypothetical protein
MSAQRDITGRAGNFAGPLPRARVRSTLCGFAASEARRALTSASREPSMSEAQKE